MHTDTVNMCTHVQSTLCEILLCTLCACVRASGVTLPTMFYIQLFLCVSSIYVLCILCEFCASCTLCALCTFLQPGEWRDPTDDEDYRFVYQYRKLAITAESEAVTAEGEAATLDAPAAPCVAREM